jgi:hypothetical protein
MYEPGLTRITTLNNGTIKKWAEEEKPKPVKFNQKVPLYWTFLICVAAPEWRSGLRHFISVLNVSLQTPWFNSRLHHNRA